MLSFHILFFTQSTGDFSLKSEERDNSEMCPLRIILIFLSATLAGLFVLRNLNSSPAPENDAVKEETESPESVPLSSKVCTALGKGFWTCVDMASGRYLWRNLVLSGSSSTDKPSAD